MLFFGNGGVRRATIATKRVQSGLTELKACWQGTAKTSGGIVTVAEGFREGQTEEGSRS